MAAVGNIKKKVYFSAIESQGSFKSEVEKYSTTKCATAISPVDGKIP